MKDTQSIFEKRVEEFRQKADELRSRSKSLSTTRIVCFIVAVIIIVQLANRGQSKLVLVASLLFILLFIVLLKSHNKVRRALLFQEALESVNHQELNRKQLQLSELDTGEQFYDAQHDFHEDLDIFGRHSLFQLINRSATADGKQRVANWLSQSADIKTIPSRQDSIKELKGKLEFRQNFQASGMVNDLEEGSKEVFLDWLKSNSKLKKKGLFTFSLIIFPLLTVSSIVGVSLGYLEMGWPILISFINMIFLGFAFNPLNEIGKQTENGYKSIGILKELILLVENESFQEEKLKEMQQKIKQGSQSAAQTLSQLKFLLDTIHNRANMLYIIFDVLLLLDVYWLIRIHNWKEKNKLELQQWFDVMAEFDALNSMAGYAFANPENTFPKILENDFTISALQMGHPLISANQRVNNDFNFKGKGGICLITGSNMSGKSTFLRTLGVNIILAQAGAPVCASSLQLGLARVFTSMRTKDELEENVSSFYAELKRLKKLIDSIDESKPTLFMIDEVLKGTNSEDRHKGAIALIKQLNKAHAFGLVSTHDLVLGSLANQLEGVKNYSFNSIIQGDEIIFDYTLTDGICKSFNATKLMQNMGIEIPDE